MRQLSRDDDGKFRCFKKHIVKAQERTMYYRGRYFAGLMCVPCNSLFDNPDDSLLAFAAECAKGKGPQFGETISDHEFRARMK